MRKLLIIIATAVTMTAPAHAATAFYKGEFISGQNKICIYEFLGQSYFRTIRAYQGCPYSIKV